MKTVHTCHWPNCTQRVPPARWGCRKHWFALPLRLRNRIWATYVPGQETTKSPSAAYIAAAKEAQQWIAERELVADNKLPRDQQRRAAPAVEQPQLYRPPNGTEGDCFISAWCQTCALDVDENCPILARTFQHAITDPAYPREWCYDDAGQPQCTSYIPEGDPVPPPRCERTTDMFGFPNGGGQ